MRPRPVAVPVGGAGTLLRADVGYDPGGEHVHAHAVPRLLRGEGSRQHQEGALRRGVGGGGAPGPVAVEASLTGHTVFSTVHTNDAPSTVTRLVDMGIAPFLISATLEAVVAQRLVRRICPDCREAYEPEEEVLLEFGPQASMLSGATFYFGRGCEACFHTGHRGRSAIFEILEVDEEVRRAILEGASAGELRDMALRSGMRTLRTSGIEAVLAGVTTIEEVLRETTL